MAGVPGPVPLAMASHTNRYPNSTAADAATDALRGFDPTVDRSLDWLATHGSRTPRPFPGPLRCIHNDLSPEHLLVDRRTGALAGILDWSDAIVGDPALDFAPLAAFHGWAFVDEVVRSYPLTIDGSFRQRLRFMARRLSVMRPRRFTNFRS